MKKPLHIIYVPGLGDHRLMGQQAAVNTWRWWGVEAQLFQMNWADKEAWEPKFKRLIARIDKAADEGKDVALVAASAGAAAAINAYAARKQVTVGVVCIAGKINRPQAIGAGYRQKNPAFVTAAYKCEAALKNLDKADRRRIRTYHSPLDGVVTTQDSVIPGASNRLTPVIWHVFVIAAMISLGAPFFIGFLKRQQG
jgi:predicted alpha/beta hydrolase family esterase